jgi:NADH:ubiquinone oxidoreductase subunit 2 (subunit N)
MLDPSFNAIVPMTCVTLAAIAVMLAEAFREPGERMPMGGLAVIGLAGAAAACVLLWDRNFSSFGLVAADNFGLFVSLILALVGIMTVMFSPGRYRPRRPAGR